MRGPNSGLHRERVQPRLRVRARRATGENLRAKAPKSGVIVRDWAVVLQVEMELRLGDMFAGLARICLVFLHKRPTPRRHWGIKLQ